MLLIVCEHIDFSADEVCKWLNYYGKKFELITDSSRVRLEYITLSNGKCQTLLFNSDSNRLINLSKLKCYWYRRGEINFVHEIDILPKIVGYNGMSYGLTKFLRGETEELKEYIDFELCSRKYIGSMREIHRNKLIQLKYASYVGLDIPQTIIATSKKNLIESNLLKNKLITKGIRNSVSFATTKKSYFNSTSKVRKADVDNTNNFFPSLFQQKIDKKFELRIFFIKGKIYAMAIFSQKNMKTKLDYRNYDLNNPNRMVPFTLNRTIQHKIKRLFKTLNLTTGSVDMIYTNNRKYVFLEINPVGQFGMVSKPCNYYLEKEIAKLLN
jgi:ATP-GRASP peptide maturase of grasp-with-spasm system